MSALDHQSLMRAFETVEEIVGLGGYHEDPRAIEGLLALPEGLTPCPPGDVRLYRVFALDAQAYADLIGPGIRLKPAAIASWTRSSSAARMIARGTLKRTATHRAITVARAVPGAQILVDVAALYRRLSFDQPCVESWDLYARWEEEVFVRDMAALDLTSADIVHEADPADREAYRPLDGERIWVEADEEMDTIQQVEGPATTRKAVDHWRVVTEGGHAGWAYYDERHHSWNLRRG